MCVVSWLSCCRDCRRQKPCAALIPPVEASYTELCRLFPPFLLPTTTSSPLPATMCYCSLGCYLRPLLPAGMYDQGCDNWVTLCDADFTLESEEASCSYLKKDHGFRSPVLCPPCPTSTESPLLCFLQEIGQGIPCKGNISETATCNAHTCPVDCVMTDWAEARLPSLDEAHYISLFFFSCLCFRCLPRNGRRVIHFATGCKRERGTSQRMQPSVVFLAVKVWRTASELFVQSLCDVLPPIARTRVAATSASTVLGRTGAHGRHVPCLAEVAQPAP